MQLEQFHNFTMTIGFGPIQGSLSPFVLCKDVATVVEEPFDRFKLTGLSGYDERCTLIRIPRLGICSSINENPERLATIISCCLKEWRAPTLTTAF